MAAVQALPPAPAAQTSPAAAVSAPSANPMATPWGAGALHQRLNSFVKKTLLQQLVPAGAVVCDLFCGRGVDTENWAEAQISKYVGVDLSASALEEAKEQWEKNGKPFAATFRELNPCMAHLEKHLGENSFRADVVTCLAHLQDCFVSKDQVHCLLQNVSALLKPGGYFFGATPDSSTIWYKYQKAVEGAMKAGSLRANGQLPRVRTDLYSISFEDDRFHEYGSRYQLRFADESLPPQSQVLVHFPSLIRGAEEVGLEYVEIQNLYEFYEDYRGPFAETLQSSCGSLVDAKGHPVVDVKSRLSPVAQDVLSLYTTFIFKKPAPIQHVNPLQVPTPMSSSAAADVKRNGKKPSSSAVLIKSTAPELKEEVIPRKKQRISSSAPEEGAPKGAVPASPEEIVKKEASKPAPVATKHENSRSGSRGLKSLGRDLKTGNSHPSMSSSKAEERVSKVVDSPSAVAAAGVTTMTGPQKHFESPSQNASKSKDVEQQQAPPRLGSPNPPKTEDSKRESSRSGNKSLKASDKPSSSRRRSESQQRSDTSGRGNPETNPETDRQGSESGQSQDSLKRKREARGGRSYTPAAGSASAPVPSSGGESNERRTKVERRSSQRRTGFSSSPSEQQQQERGANLTTMTREPASSHAGAPRSGDGDSLPKQAVNVPSASRTRQTNAGHSRKKDVSAEHEESPSSTQKESSTTVTTMEQGKPPGGSTSSHKRKITAVAKEEHLVATPQKELERPTGGDDNKARSTTPAAAAAAAVEATSDGGAMMQAKEEAMIASENPQKKRERPVTELHYERRATQKRVSATASANVNKVNNKRESDMMTTEAATQQPPPEREAATRKASLVTTEVARLQGDDGVLTNCSGRVAPWVVATSQKLDIASGDEPPPGEKDAACKNKTLVTEGQLEGTKSQSGNEAMEVGLETKERTAPGSGPDEKRHPPPREPQLEELATIESGTNVVGVGVSSEKIIVASQDNKVAAQKKAGSVASEFVAEKRDHTGISDALPEKESSQNREAFITADGESLAEKGAKRRRESNALDQLLVEEGLSQMRESNVAMMKHSTQMTESSSVAMVMAMEPVPSERGSNQVNLEISEPRVRRGFSPKRGGMTSGDSHSSRNQGITKEVEAAWPETAPQRYTRRRAMAAMAQAVEGGAAAVPENPPIWQNNRGTNFGAAQIEREQQQQQQSSSPVFHPGRLPPFVTPVSSNFASLSRPPMRSVVDRRDTNSKSHDGPGLLGAAPPHIIINSQRERRYDSIIGPSSDLTMAARNRPLRGPMFINKERGSRNPSEFANSAPHSSGGPNNNGPGMPWEEHMKGDSRSRNNR